MKYDEFMDQECIPLCDMLNSLKGVKTFESCCGHCKKPYVIYMTISNFYSLSLLSRAFDWRYNGFPWRITVSSKDTPNKKSGVAVFTLETTIVPEDEVKISYLVSLAIINIKYWLQPQFEKYLKGEK